MVQWGNLRKPWSVIVSVGVVLGIVSFALQLKPVIDPQPHVELIDRNFSGTVTAGCGVGPGYSHVIVWQVTYTLLNTGEASGLANVSAYLPSNHSRMAWIHTFVVAHAQVTANLSGPLLVSDCTSGDIPVVYVAGVEKVCGTILNWSRCGPTILSGGNGVVDTPTLIIAAVGWALAVFFGIRDWMGQKVTKSFYDAYVRTARPIDFGGGVTARLVKTRFGTYAVEWSQPLKQDFKVDAKLETEKIPGEKEQKE